MRLFNLKKETTLNSGSANHTFKELIFGLRQVRLNDDMVTLEVYYFQDKLQNTTKPTVISNYTLTTKDLEAALSGNTTAIKMQDLPQTLRDLFVTYLLSLPEHIGATEIL